MEVLPPPSAEQGYQESEEEEAADRHEHPDSPPGKSQYEVAWQLAEDRDAVGPANCVHDDAEENRQEEEVDHGAPLVLKMQSAIQRNRRANILKRIRSISRVVRRVGR